MNNAIKYLDAALLEDFCLGLLPEKEAMEIVKASEKYPEVKQRIEEIEEALKAALQMPPSQQLKAKIFGQISQSAAATINLSSPPLIDKYSNAAAWRKAVQSLQPMHDGGAIQVCPILETKEVSLCVAWLHGSIEEEGHTREEFAESFLIIEGSCQCNIGGTMHYLEAGGFLEIPFDVKHTITATSKQLGFVKAILQRKKVA